MTPKLENLTSSDFEVRRKKAKILLFDIETAPNVGYIWGKYQQDVIEYTSEWYILCWSAKWLDGKQTTKCLADYDGYKPGSENDVELVSDLYQLLQSADIVVAHNGDKFDVKRVNTRFIEHGLEPTAPFKTVDTCKVARKHFGFNSNKLDDLGRRLGVGRKVKTGGFELWKGCLQGDPKSWARMKRYNRQDVLLLESVYLKLRPWMPQHPNIGAITEAPDACRNCGGSNLHAKGWKYNLTTKQQRWRCRDCGAYMAGKSQRITDIR